MPGDRALGIGLLGRQIPLLPWKLTHPERETDAVMEAGCASLPPWSEWGFQDGGLWRGPLHSSSYLQEVSTGNCTPRRLFVQITG